MQDNWISVEDRLPKLGIEVLVCYKKSTVKEFSQTIASIESMYEYYSKETYSMVFTNEEDKELWVGQDGVQIESGIDFYAVYFWQELPTPPTQ
jgi:hypothetical protein